MKISLKIGKSNEEGLSALRPTIKLEHHQLSLTNCSAYLYLKVSPPSAVWFNRLLSTATLSTTDHVHCSVKAGWILVHPLLILLLYRTGAAICSKPNFWPSGDHQPWNSPQLCVCTIPCACTIFKMYPGSHVPWWCSAPPGILPWSPQLCQNGGQVRWVG
jgi:hypothetical protein